ncbi:uncharacterized protein EV420DRAFT_1205425 [Desarmillaria tabescens]|uniref:Uncharacterized protein n=1 Tax=Armillaria tabescens TaxID=1929756 RepID=A0AA39JAS3_ARMTA|nr:uncharacterized protein EV420DRAFT_1205425 [Desarmillaria tabescens]KAK0438884.1 hypothetical protein EV420DRAFT_1205425 [Desarmillaria tabescens]
MRAWDVHRVIQYPIKAACLSYPQARSSQSVKKAGLWICSRKRSPSTFLTSLGEFNWTRSRMGASGRERRAYRQIFGVSRSMLHSPYCVHVLAVLMQITRMGYKAAFCVRKRSIVLSTPSFKPFRSSPPYTSGLTLTGQLPAACCNTYARPARLAAMHASDNMSAGSSSQDVRLALGRYRTQRRILHPHHLHVIDIQHATSQHNGATVISTTSG